MPNHYVYSRNRPISCEYTKLSKLLTNKLETSQQNWLFCSLYLWSFQCCHFSCEGSSWMIKSSLGFCINCNTLQNNNFYHWHFWQLEFFVLFLSKITATFSGSFMNTPISFENQSNFDHQTWNSTTELTLLPSDQFRANLFNGINAGALSDLGARHRPRLARR